MKWKWSGPLGFLLITHSGPAPQYDITAASLTFCASILLSKHMWVQADRGVKGFLFPVNELCELSFVNHIFSVKIVWKENWEPLLMKAFLQSCSTHISHYWVHTVSMIEVKVTKLWNAFHRLCHFLTQTKLLKKRFSLRRKHYHNTKLQEIFWNVSQFAPSTYIENEIKNIYVKSVSSIECWARIILDDIYGGGWGSCGGI